MQIKFLITVILWVTAAGLAGWLLLGKQDSNTIQLDIEAIPETASAETTGITKNISATTMLKGAKFTGRDINGRTWELNAKEAGRNGAMGEDVILLTTVTATIGSVSGKDINFMADSGYYDSKQNFISLHKNVTVTGYGLTLTSPKLTTNLETRNLNAGPKVSITGQFGTWLVNFKARHLTIYGTSPIIKLTGGVTGRFKPTLAKIEEVN